MRKLIYHIAASLDGFIAHTDGSFDGFSWDDRVVGDFLKSITEDYDTVLMGRHTYDVGLKEGKTSPYPHMAQYLCSRSLKDSPDPEVTLVSQDLVSLVSELKEQDRNKNIWLCGGGQIATQLLEAGLIDQVILKLNPILLGAGIPLFHGDVGLQQFTLQRSKVYGCGVLLLRYDLQL